MAQETVNGVTNFYGPRSSYEGFHGTQGRHNDLRQLVIAFSGADYGDVSFTLEAGSTIVGPALVEVNEAFTLSGTDATILVGATTPATNYVATIPSASAAAVGTYSLASGGILAENTPLAEDTTITVSLGGTGASVTGVGKLKLVVPYKLI